MTLLTVFIALVFLYSLVSARMERTVFTAPIVLLSIFAHGLSARPGIKWYAARVAKLGPGAPERQDCEA